jgi:uncharacterized membrane protein HdeD (DUF308 family)
MSALKYLGILLLLIGVVTLTAPVLAGHPSNTFLLIGILTIIVGFVGHIVLNRKAE